MLRLPLTFRRWRRFSSIVKANLVRLCAVILGLVVFAAAQDLSPAFLGSKAPLLMIFGCLAGIPASIGAGLFTDALGGLPFGCSAVFFAVTAQGVRMAGRAMAITIVIASAAIYQLWIAMWSEGGDTLLAMAGALMSATVITPVMCALMRLVRRRIGIDSRMEAS